VLAEAEKVQTWCERPLFRPDHPPIDCRELLGSLPFQVRQVLIFFAIHTFPSSTNINTPRRTQYYFVLYVRLRIHVSLPGGPGLLLALCAWGVRALRTCHGSYHS
jgi:hypothetical protein